MNLRNTLSLIVIALISSSVNARDVDNHALSYYCGGKNVEFEKQISVGNATRVSLNEGPFYQIEQKEAFEPTLYFIEKQIVSTGVDEKCSEFLLSNGTLQATNEKNILARVYFDFDKSTLTDKSKYVLDNVMELVKHNSRDLVLEGHTDAVGNKAYNFSLGLKRSESVQAYLVKNGLNTSQLKATSNGELEPIADNSTVKGREQNRRVDIQ